MIAMEHNASGSIIKSGLFPDSSPLSDIILWDRYFQKSVQVSAEQIFSDVLNLITFHIVLSFSKSPLETKKKCQQNQPTKPTKQTKNFSRRSKKSNFSKSFKTDFSDPPSLIVIINQGQG